MHETNPELRLAEAFVEETDCPVFLTGKAGTGKTTFLQELAGRTGKRLIVTAPTGVAAINAGGVTLHSFFQLPFGPMVPGDTSFFARHRFSRDKRNIVRSLEQNRAAALARLTELVVAAATPRRKRRPTRPTRGSVQRRLETKNRHSRTKALRRKPE